VSLRGPTGLFVRDSSSQQIRPILTTLNPCDGFRRPAWSRDGSRIALVFDRAYGPPTPIAGGSACPGAVDRLAIVVAGGASAGAVLQLIAPDRGCAFGSVAFDRAGLAAAEGCRHGSPPGQSATNLGNAYLLQFNHDGARTRRVALERGLEQALVATLPGRGNVLVTQDQPANEGPEYDWVWEFNGSRLRPIAHYRALDAAQVIAVPW
jgi:hypothetical protein